MATCKRPCLNCQMKRCLCPCSGKVDPAEYARMVEGVTLLLQGRSEDLRKNLENEMEIAARELRFEEAARVRDRLSAVRRTLEAQNVSFFHFKDLDVMCIVSGNTNLFVVAVLSFRQGKLLATDSFVIRNPALDEQEVLTSSIKQYYVAGAFVPKEVLLSRPVDQPELIQAWLSELRGAKVTLRAPVRGHGARLVELALKNAENELTKEKHRDSTEIALARIAAKFHLAEAPVVIEGYDISNISGSEPVGVKISFRGGQPDKTAYRQYKIKGFPNQDDPGMIYQTVSRRAGHRDEEPLPDLFLIDGGKSQLNAACAALKDTFGAGFPAVAAIAKARGEGAQERFYLPDRKNPVLFPKGDPGLMLLMSVRDEAHRFAHSKHTKSRLKAVLRSSLDEVVGIGGKKRQALLTRFGSLKGLLSASDEEILAVPGIGKKDLESIREYFEEKEKTKSAEALPRQSDTAATDPIFKE
jgi:excinuclease ABC subunit C